MKANILPFYMLTTPGWGQRDQIFFSDECHVAYQIKRKAVYTIMQVKCLTLCTYLTFYVGQQGQTLKLCRYSSGKEHYFFSFLCYQRTIFLCEIE